MISLEDELGQIISSLHISGLLSEIGREENLETPKKLQWEKTFAK